MVGVGGAVLGGLVGDRVRSACSSSEVRREAGREGCSTSRSLPVVMNWVEVIAPMAMARRSIISYLATIYPAMTAAQLRPVQGLRDD